MSYVINLKSLTHIHAAAVGGGSVQLRSRSAPA